MKSVINKAHLKITVLLLLSLTLGLQCLAQNRIKKMDYDYDLVSGNVKQVTYQANHPEVFIQQYSYDTDNRMTEVRSSSDGVIFNRDAAYTYYQHGPMSRTVLGDNKVQGLDYTYTLQGWLKAVNSNVLDVTKDPGKDGQISSKTARDVFSYSLGYYSNDYNSIAGSLPFLATVTGSALDANTPELFSGNIRYMTTALTDNNGTQLDVQANGYRYDQLNRLKQSEMYVLNKSTNSFAGVSASTMYKENFSYDANGNIINLTRNGNAAIRLMDQLTYLYPEEGGKKVNNKLLHVNDAALKGTYSIDVDNQGTFVANDTATWNYRYDEMGNLVFDRQSGIEKIEWNVAGKIKSIHRFADSVKSDLEFKYDALGHRIAKIEKPFGHLNDVSQWIYTYYVVDATGKTLAVYNKRTVEGEEAIMLKEQYVYGSKRLGNVQRDLDVSDPFFPMPNATPTFQRVLGKKQYELNNHLGNVLAVISDRRITHLNASAVPDYYVTEVSSATDYYAFGSPMPGRSIMPDNYRYGFSGKEKDNEIRGNGNSYDFGARMIDVRLGRWLNIDPLAAKFAGWSPYNYVLNNPVVFVDENGLAPKFSKEFMRIYKNEIKAFNKITLYKELAKNYNSSVSLSRTLSVDGQYNEVTEKRQSDGTLKQVPERILLNFQVYIGADPIYLFSSLMHELKHADLKDKFSDTETDDLDHELMATSYQLESHINALKAYDKNRNQVHREEFYTALAWGGLYESVRWEILPPEQQDLYEKINETMSAMSKMFYYQGILDRGEGGTYIDASTGKITKFKEEKRAEFERYYNAQKEVFEQNYDVYEKYIAPLASKKGK